jgi:hypothetical protein
MNGVVEIISASALLLFILPLMLIFEAVIKLESSGPVLRNADRAFPSVHPDRSPAAAHQPASRGHRALKTPIGAHPPS